MGIGSGMAVAGIVGGAASLGGAALQSNAAGNAASEQSQAAEQAAQLQYQASQNALGFDEQQYNNSQNELAPYLQSGTGALSNLDYLMGVSPQSANGGQTYSGMPMSSQPASLAGGSAHSPASAQAVPQPGVAAPASGLRSTLDMGAGQPQSLAGRPVASTPNSAVPGTLSLPGGASSQVPGSGLSTAVKTPPTFASSPSAASPGGYGSLLAPYSGTFTAPTAQQALNSPGEQAQLQLGEQAMQQSAAAQGNLLTGGTAQALDAYGQNLASTNYQNTYNDAYNTYAAGYNQYQNQQSNEFNRLSALAGGGYTAANTLGTLGANMANSASSNVLGTASAMGQDYNNAAAANASGMIGSANAYSGALGSSASNLTQMAMLQSILGGSSGAGSGTSTLNTGGGMGMTGGYDYGAPPVDTAGLAAYGSSEGY